MNSNSKSKPVAAKNRSSNIFQNKPNLCVLAPHTAAFIGDQLRPIAREMNLTNVLIPIPFVPQWIQVVPRFSEHRRLRQLVFNNPVEGARRYVLQYPLLPTDLFMKRSSRLISRISLNMLSRLKFSPTILHAHFLHPCGTAATLIKKSLNVPLVTTAHGQDVYTLPFKDRQWKSLVESCISSSDGIIAVCKRNRDILISLGARPRDVHIIPNGYDSDLFFPCDKVDCRSSLGLRKTSQLILFVGNLVEEKGLLDLLAAFKIVAEKYLDVYLAIVGSGPLEFAAQNWIRHHNLNSRILMCGAKPHREIPIWMNACDLFVLPSISEGFPTVIPESLACGKPVICTKVGGTSEIISSKQVGLLLEPNNVDSLAEGMIKGLHEKWDIRAIRQHAGQYSWDNLVPKIISVYEAVLSNE